MEVIIDGAEGIGVEDNTELWLLVEEAIIDMGGGWCCT